MMRLSILLLLWFSVTQAYAFNLYTWFENINQRATRLLAEKKYTEAEKTFTKPDWQAVAAYRGENYQKAVEQFKQLGGPLGLYNQGNALAYLGKYQNAIEAYEKALKLDPTHEDAKYNRDLLKKLLKDNPQNQQNQNNQDNNQEQQDNQQNKEDRNNSQQNNNDNNPAEDNLQNRSDSNKEDSDKNEHDKNQNKDNHDQNEPEDNKDKQDKDPEKSEKNAPQEPKQSKAEQAASQQEKEQALRLIPDDPGGLLREKFWRDHWRRLKAEQS
ncbi:MAG: tetratricopeptide repeat protein [Legionellaceae bacterium]|nr:tetratricopeptide repeat protein [Legionellaceae bacterium]